MSVERIAERVKAVLATVPEGVTVVAAAKTRSAITRGRWHHVVAVDDGRQLHIYLDGTHEDSSPFGMDAKLNESPVTFGARQSARGGYGEAAGSLDIRL